MSDFKKKSDDALAILDTIEQAVAKSAGRFDELRTRADEVFEARIEQLAQLNGVDINKAHGLAVTDPVASRAYALSSQLAERQDHAREAGGHLASHLD